MDLLRQTPVEQRLFSPIKLDGGELLGIEVRREWRNIDLLITCDNPSFVIAIENKINTSEHSNQLARYQKTIHESDQLKSYKHKQFVYLTPDGSEASEDDWTVYSYSNLYRVLKKTRDASVDQIGEDVTVFLDHYLRILRSRFMDDPEIIEACREIYKNHRQAIDLIIANAGSPIVEQIHEAIEADSENWVVLNKYGRGIDFLPKEWYEILPAIGIKSQRGDKGWLHMTIYLDSYQDVSRVQWNPACQQVSNESLRTEIVKALVKEPKAFGLKRSKGSALKPGWNSLGAEQLLKWSSKQEPDLGAISNAVTECLQRRLPALQKATPVLKKIIETYEK
jgi:hypothetical protein